jgi:DNA primase
MQHSAKYLIHAEIRTSGVVERSDVVGAVFGQTEGLLGEELDLRTLQEASKVGRIDVDIDTADGQSVGTVTVASALDRVETAVLAASFETIDRVGPSRAECQVVELEDVRAAKRRDVVDRATELLAEFEQQTVTGENLIEEVRKRARVADITEYAGLPAGPRVADSDAVVVVEGRADVLQLLEYGIKNAIAVEGTDVPEAVIELTETRTTTAFLDGDRGGELILEELRQVGDPDQVAFAPPGRSVEDLEYDEARAALHEKVPTDQFEDESTESEPVAPTDGGTVTTAPDTDTEPDGAAGPEPPTEGGTDDSEAGVSDESDTSEDTAEAGDAAAGDGERTSRGSPTTVPGHVESITGSGRVRLLDEDASVLAEAEADAAFDTVAEAEVVPRSVVLDGEVTQRLLDVAAQRGVGQLVGTETGELVKQPASVRVRTADSL